MRPLVDSVGNGTGTIVSIDSGEDLGKAKRTLRRAGFANSYIAFDIRYALDEWKKACRVNADYSEGSSIRIEGNSSGYRKRNKV